ncbi:hypothetical protein Dimus_000487 [Dionaea muscipula]
MLSSTTPAKCWPGSFTDGLLVTSFERIDRAILEPASDEPEEQEAGDVEEAESEADDTSDTEGTIDTEKLQMDLESNHGKGSSDYPPHGFSFPQ